MNTGYEWLRLKIKNKKERIKRIRNEAEERIEKLEIEVEELEVQLKHFKKAIINNGKK